MDEISMPACIENKFFAHLQDELKYTCSSISSMDIKKYVVGNNVQYEDFAYVLNARLNSLQLTIMGLQEYLNKINKMGDY